MQQHQFRENHLIKILSLYESKSTPLDMIISDYFRNNKAIGSKDRALIAEKVYSLVRWQGLIDYLIGPSISWEKRLDCLAKVNLEECFKNAEIPSYVRVSFPQTLYDFLTKSHGEEKASTLCLTSNQPAPTTIRINPLKTTRQWLLNHLAPLYQVSPCQHSELGIRFHKRINLFSLTAFQEGLFEMQDEGSQLLAHLIQVEPGQHVLDFCAGSGGKTLAFAHKLQEKGQIYLHDIRMHALAEAKKRLKRAGIQNAQVVPPNSSNLNKLKHKMDWILVDAPCSGTGTLRRNPDMKWRFSSEMLFRLVEQQRQIFEQALAFLKPGGRIVYATCSILKEENEEQIEHFMRTHNLQLVNPPFQSLPEPGEMDGFFGAVFRS